MMPDGAAASPETAGLEARIVALEAALRDAQRLLGACALTTLSAGLLARRLGQEQEAILRAAGVTPDFVEGLSILQRQTRELEATMLEVMGRAE
jgi:hypothetical protein